MFSLVTCSMHAQPGFIGYKTCRRLEGYFCSDTSSTSIITHNCCTIYRPTKHEATPGDSTDWMDSLFVNLLDLGDDILVLIHPDWLLSRTTVDSRGRQETLQRETVERREWRGDWKEQKREMLVLIWCFLTGSSSGIFNCHLLSRKESVKIKIKVLYRKGIL